MRRFYLGLCAVLLAAPCFVETAFAQTPGWLADTRAGCRVWTPNTQANESVSWSGGCVNGLAQGRGVAQWVSEGKTVFRYEGDYREGKANGRGVAVYSDGGRYEGEFVNDMRHGQGKHQFASGNRYDGNWANGERAGQGVFVWTNGTRYEGEWRGIKRNGRGVTIYPSLDARYEGEYRDDLPNGSGTLATRGTTYSGSWNNGCFQQGSRRMALDVSNAECGFQ